MLPREGVVRRAGEPWRLGRDYDPQVGGVVPMMRGLLRASVGRWAAPDPRWLCLGDPSIPDRFSTDEGYTVETIALEPDVRRRYVEFKEAVWRSFHGPWGMGPFPGGAYRGYVELNHRVAQRILDHLDRFDVVYVNDFQLLLVGGLVGSAAPAILRWHIPLELRGYPDQVRRFFLRAMEGSDAIVVSTRSALEELIHQGFHGKAFQVYPYLDPSEHLQVADSEVRRFREANGLGDHPYVISVGRMDPVKRQDLLLEAFGRLRRRFPDHRLVLVGGGSFSTSLSGAVGGPRKDVAWSRRLHELMRSRHLEGSVVLPGRVSGETLRAAYQGASAFVHPAPWEGFGLVAVEAWMHGLPIIVSRGAGVSELVTDGVNGYTVRPGSVPGMSARLEALLARPELAERMGAAGRLTARRCYVGTASSRLREIFRHVLRTYRGHGRPPPEHLRG